MVANLQLLRAQHDELTFVGGEPTLHPNLAALIASARAAGFSRVGIQTNARRLADRQYLQSLVDAGLSDVHVSLHGSEAAVHDYHTGVEGSFTEAMNGLAASVSKRLPVVAVSVLARSNFRSLSGLPTLLKARGVQAWLVEVPWVAGRARDAFDRVVPRLGLALPFALHALSTAAKVSLPSFVRGAPHCLLGPFAARALPSEPRAYGAACEACAAKPRCPGVDPAYLERFGGDELRAVAVAVPVAVTVTVAGEGAAVVASAGDSLTRMFVGVGERARPPLQDPVRPRMSLPQVGRAAERAQPARAEVSTASPKRSGDALREILPGLFDPEKREQEK